MVISQRSMSSHVHKAPSSGEGISLLRNITSIGRSSSHAVHPFDEKDGKSSNDKDDVVDVRPTEGIPLHENSPTLSSPSRSVDGAPRPT